MKCDDNITSRTTDNICQKNSNQSTHVSYHLFPPPSSNPNIILTKENLSDSIDWTNNQSKKSSNKTTINNQLDAKHFFQEYLHHGNSDVLIDFLHDLEEEINLNHYSYSTMNNNHRDLTPMFNSNLQLSNNKEKKNKKEKSDEKAKKEEENEIISKKPNKSKEKVKKIEETISTTTTTDSNILPNSPFLIKPTYMNLTNPRSPSYSPAETIGFPSLSIPVPQSSVSSIHNPMSPDPSRMHTSQQSNIVHLSQVQHQLQTDSQNKTTYPSHNMSVQQQLQSLSQIARDGDEILITLSVNALTQKQQINNNQNMQYNQPPFQNNPYSTQSWNQTIPSSTGIVMPRNLEIVAKGFARVQNEHPPLPPSNSYPQQQSMIPSYNQIPFTSVHPSFVPRYPMPCQSSNGPPQIPIGPPIQPIFAAPNTMMSGGFIQPPNKSEFTPDMRNNFDNTRHRSDKNIGKCDYLCQSSFYQPDFRGRPSPNITTNPYYSNPPLSMNFSAKQASKQYHPQNFEQMNRTYSSIY